MRLSLVTETFAPEVNGVAMTLGRLCRGLGDLGWAVTVVRPRQANEPKGGQAKDTLIVPGFPIPFYRSLRFGWPALRQLRSAWKAQRPDVVHIATEGPLGWAALRVARQLGVPVTSSFHTNFHQYGGHYGMSLVRPLALRYLRWFHNATDITLAPTRSLCDELAGAGFKRLGVMARGVDAALFHPSKRSAKLREAWGVTASDPVVLYVGRLAAEKNLATAVEGFLALRRNLPKARFVLVGDGPEAPRLKAMYPEFEYTGVRRGEELAAHYASADLFLFPSLTETFGNVVTEAMASGLPVVAFDYAAAGEYLRPSGAGWTPHGSETALFVAACEDAAREFSTWPARSAKARQVAEGLSWSEVVQRFANDLARIAKA